MSLTIDVPNRVDLPQGHDPTPQGELHHAAGEALPRRRGRQQAPKPAAAGRLDRPATLPSLCSRVLCYAGEAQGVAYHSDPLTDLSSIKL
jgi:hypothetical protein